MAKMLKNGADCPTRTGDLMITNRNAALFANDNSVNRDRDAPLLFSHLPLPRKPRKKKRPPKSFASREEAMVVLWAARIRAAQEISDNIIAHPRRYSQRK